MRVVFVGGAGRRTVGEYVWQGPGDVVEVEDAAVLMTLLLQPGEQFAVSADEPLLQIEGINEDVAGSLALERVVDVKSLAGLSAWKVGRVAKVLRIEREVVRGWVEQAGTMK